MINLYKRLRNFILYTILRREDPEEELIRIIRKELGDEFNAALINELNKEGTINE